MKPGKITEPQCKRSVLKWLPKTQENVVQGAGIGNQCSIFMQNEKEQVVSAMATVSLRTKEAEKYAYWNAMNKLRSSGAIPQAIMVNVMLPARGGEERIRYIVSNLTSLCETQKISYLGGHTELLEELRAPIITVIAYGLLNNALRYQRISEITPGQSIIAVGSIALEALHMLVSDFWDQLHERYPSNYLRIAQDISGDLSLDYIYDCLNSYDEANHKRIYIHTMSTGGIFAGLWELGEASNCGIEVQLKDIPIKQETVEISNFFDINPYMAFSGGCALLVTDYGEEILDYLEKNGIFSILIGHITNQNDRIVRNEEARFLTPPKGDDLYKLYHGMREK